MINLELLFWASKNDRAKKLYDIVVSHAGHTMKNQFKPDYSCQHVALYDTITGKFIKGITHQGYSDKFMWPRGTGHWPNNSEVDASIIYTDYYIEALLRLKKLTDGENPFKIEGYLT